MRDYTKREGERRYAESGCTGAGRLPRHGPCVHGRSHVPSVPRSRPRWWDLHRKACKPGAIGSETSFGAVLAGALAMKRVSVQSALYQSRQMVDLLVYFVVKTTRRPAWPHRFEVWLVKTGDLSLNRLKSLHRNSFGCQADRDYCTETCLAAIRATRQELIGRPERPCGYYDPPIHAACELFVAMLPRSRRRRH